MVTKNAKSYLQITKYKEKTIAKLNKNADFADMQYARLFIQITNRGFIPRFGNSGNEKRQLVALLEGGRGRTTFLSKIV